MSHTDTNDTALARLKVLLRPAESSITYAQGLDYQGLLKATDWSLQVILLGKPMPTASDAHLIDIARYGVTGAGILEYLMGHVTVSKAYLATLLGESMKSQIDLGHAAPWNGDGKLRFGMLHTVALRDRLDIIDGALTEAIMTALDRRLATAIQAILPIIGHDVGYTVTWSANDIARIEDILVRSFILGDGHLTILARHVLETTMPNRGYRVGDVEVIGSLLWRRLLQIGKHKSQDDGEHIELTYTDVCEIRAILVEGDDSGIYPLGPDSDHKDPMVLIEWVKGTVEANKESNFALLVHTLHTLFNPEYQASEVLTNTLLEQYRALGVEPPTY